MFSDRFLFPLPVWRFLAVVGLMIIIWAGFRPDPIPQYVTDLDKWLHACAFAGLTGLFILAFPRIHWLGIASSMLALGFLIEVGQDIFLPRRTFDWGDFAVDAIGVLAGLLLLMVMMALKNSLMPPAAEH